MVVTRIFADLLGNTKNLLTIRILGDILVNRDIALQDAKYGNAESGYIQKDIVIRNTSPCNVRRYKV